MEQKTKAIIGLVASAFFWSTGGLFIKLVDWNSFAIAGGRSLFAGIVLLVYIKRPRLNFSLPMIGAAISSTTTMILYVLANKMTTAANTVLLQYTAPVFVAILAWLILKERPTSDNWIALILIIFGMLLFFSEKLSTGNMMGNILALISGISLAFFAVLMRMQGKSTFDTYLLAHLITFAVSIPFIITSTLPTASGLAVIFILGVFQNGFASLLFAYGIRHISALKAMLILTLEPMLNPLWVFIFNGEVPGLYAIIGGIIIIGSVIFTTIHSSRRERSQRP